MEEKQQKSRIGRLSEMIDEMLIRNGHKPAETVTKTGSFLYTPQKPNKSTE